MSYYTPTGEATVVGLVQNLDSGLWTLDWTHGLDCGLRFGLDFGFCNDGAMTTISKRLWIEGTVLQLQARLVTELELES